MSKLYSIKECFYSPQGEGHRVGTMNVFLRFAGCNLQCTVGKEGFNCDTDFFKGEKFSLDEVVALVKGTDKGKSRKVILTGGEPTLQLDTDLCEALHDAGFFLALETNGTKPLPRERNSSMRAVDWVSCSPKPGSPPVLKLVNEVRCVVQEGQTPDIQGIMADHYFVSPACWAPDAGLVSQGWKGSSVDFDHRAMAWAVRWCEDHPNWRVSLQTHKILGVR